MDSRQTKRDTDLIKNRYGIHIELLSINIIKDKARKIPREEAIKKVTKNLNKPTRPVLAITYDPRLPCIPQILKRHWRTMVKADPHLAETFPLPPLTAYRRPENIRNKLIRSKIPEQQTRQKRIVKGMKNCGKNCAICPYVDQSKLIKASISDYTHDIESAVTCQSCNIIYCITCLHCNAQYIGESEKSLAVRFGQHKGYVRNRKFYQATGAHFNQRGHTISDMQVLVIEKYMLLMVPSEKNEKNYILIYSTPVTRG